MHLEDANHSSDDAQLSAYYQNMGTHDQTPSPVEEEAFDQLSHVEKRGVFDALAVMHERDKEAFNERLAAMTIGDAVQSLRQLAAPYLKNNFH